MSLDSIMPQQPTAQHILEQLGASGVGGVAGRAQDLMIKHPTSTLRAVTLMTDVFRGKGEKLSKEHKYLRDNLSLMRSLERQIDVLNGVLLGCAVLGQPGVLRVALKRLLHWQREGFGHGQEMGAGAWNMVHRKASETIMMSRDIGLQTVLIHHTKDINHHHEATSMATRAVLSGDTDFFSSITAQWPERCRVWLNNPAAVSGRGVGGRDTFHPWAEAALTDMAIFLKIQTLMETAAQVTVVEGLYQLMENKAAEVSFPENLQRMAPALDAMMAAVPTDLWTEKMSRIANSSLAGQLPQVSSGMLWREIAADDDGEHSDQKSGATKRM